MIIGIHQPNFFPWLGFFNKIHKADVFVYLNHVENNPRTAIYTKRVKIIVNKQEYWLTYSLKSESEKVFVPINQMLIDKPERQKDKHLKTIELNYKKAPFFMDTMPLVDAFYNHKSDLISERNIFFIESICNYLHIETKRVCSDTLNIHTASNQLLIDIVKNFGGNAYMPGGGAAGYQMDELFTQNNIEIVEQNFIHPVYPQFSAVEFISGLSIIDTLMNMGFKQTESIVKNGKY